MSALSGDSGRPKRAGHGTLVPSPPGARRGLRGCRAHSALGESEPHHPGHRPGPSSSTWGAGSPLATPWSPCGLVPVKQEAPLPSCICETDRTEPQPRAGTAREHGRGVPGHPRERGAVVTRHGPPGRHSEPSGSPGPWPSVLPQGAAFLIKLPCNARPSPFSGPPRPGDTLAVPRDAPWAVAAAAGVAADGVTTVVPLLVEVDETGLAREDRPF